MIADPRSSETYESNSLRYFESFIHILHRHFEGISAKQSQTHMPRDQIYSHIYFDSTTLHICSEFSLIPLT